MMEKKILLVDDSRFVRNTTKRLLIGMGYDSAYIFEASSGEEALTVYEKESPEIIFLDLLMPGIGGEAALKEIRKTDNDCFVTILSSNFQKPVQKRLFESGANLFIEKTITPEKLKEVMDTYEASRTP